MRYGLIGRSLGHSYSCQIHASIADDSYALCPMPPEALDDFFRQRDFLGINVTIPYKQTVIGYLDAISDEAREIGAVNTIVNRNGILTGYNTDFAGMIALIEHAGICVRGKHTLILGTGGTAKTARAVLTQLGAASVTNVSRRASPNAISYEQAERMYRHAQIMINTTPVGMYPNTTQIPIDLSHFPALEGVLDAVYRPLRTNLVLAARARGILAAGGLYMLAAQAVYASALFRQIDPDPSLIGRAYRSVLQSCRNIVLVGMPSSGKTTVGQLLASQCGMRFLDTDACIVERIGMPIADYIPAYGEAAFRQLESEVIAEAADLSGCVIATGGGAVLRPENMQALKRNGVTVFLDRPLPLLCPSADRPLSASREALEAMYARRYPLYLTADLQVDASGTPDAIAACIRKELEQ